jgi:hypothetical protein
MCSLWTKNDSEKALDNLASAFREAPRRFFTEHDLHSHLYNLVEKELESRHELFVESKDGFRRLGNGNRVQRNVCRDCGHRFSEKPLQKTLKCSLNNQIALLYNNQICALEAKNLEPQTETKTVAGVSPQAEAKGQIVGFSF